VANKTRWVCDACSLTFMVVYHNVGEDCPKTGTSEVPDVAVEQVVDTPVTGYIMPPGLQAFWDASLKKPLGANLMFVGPQGSGKTEGAHVLSAGSNMEVYKWDCASVTDPTGWFGTREIVVEDGVAVTYYSPSTFITNIERECTIILDEINRIRDEVRQVLLPLLDGSRAVTNPLNGKVVKRHDRNVIVMTGNVGLQFTGTSAIDPAFTSRAAIFKFNYPELNNEVNILRDRTGIGMREAMMLCNAANEVREKARVDLDWPTVSTRELIEVATYMQNGLDMSVALDVCLINAASDEGGSASIASQMRIIIAGATGQTR
jgi:MoxR-like ATPase